MTWIIEGVKGKTQGEVREAVEPVFKDIMEGKLSASQFSLNRQMQECLGRDRAQRWMESGGEYLSEAEIASSGFSIITSGVIHSEVIKGYESAYSKGADMVVETIKSKRKTENIPGFTATEGLRKVNEAMPYEDSSFTDKYVTVTHEKYGRIVSVTAESVQYDETGTILMIARQLGMKAADLKARLILEGVIDKNSTVYQPSGTAEALYSDSARTGQDYANKTTGLGAISAANLETVLAKLKMMKDDASPSDAENSSYIGIRPDRMVLVCHPALAVDAKTLRNSMSGLPGTANNDYNWVPDMVSYQIVENPYISTSTTWYIGDFQRQFVWSEVWPIETHVGAEDSDVAFNRDCAMRYKVRFMGNVAALDYRFVHECTA